jgi:hypothetical protein
MRVIDDDGHFVVGRGNHFEATRHSRQGAYAFGDRVER